MKNLMLIVKVGTSTYPIPQIFSIIAFEAMSSQWPPFELSSFSSELEESSVCSLMNNLGGIPALFPVKRDKPRKSSYTRPSRMEGSTHTF